MHNLLPKRLSINLLHIVRFLATDRKLLLIGLTFNGSLHKLVVNLHRHIGAGHLALGHLSIDKCLAVGVFDTYGEHQSATTAVLCHLTRRVAVTFHEGYETSGCQG